MAEYNEEHQNDRLAQLQAKLASAEEDAGYWSLQAGLALLELLDYYEMVDDTEHIAELETRARAIILVNLNLINREEHGALKNLRA